MIDELKNGLDGYISGWRQLVADRTDQTFFAACQPTAVCWKAVDQADFDCRAAVFQALSTQVHLAWLNERWLATYLLRDNALPEGIRIVKLSQRRPGSTDAPGLDHVDFLCPQPPLPVVRQETGVQWTEEKNGEHCKWISLWFDGTEAKLRTDTVLRVCADELLEHQTSLGFGAVTTCEAVDNL